MQNGRSWDPYQNPDPVVQNINRLLSQQAGFAAIPGLHVNNSAPELTTQTTSGNTNGVPRSQIMSQNSPSTSTQSSQPKVYTPITQSTNYLQPHVNVTQPSSSQQQMPKRGNQQMPSSTTPNITERLKYSTLSAALSPSVQSEPKLSSTSQPTTSILQPPPSAPVQQNPKTSTPQPPEKSRSAQPMSTTSTIEILSKKNEEILAYCQTLTNEQLNSEFSSYDQLNDETLESTAEEIAARTKLSQEFKELSEEQEAAEKEETVLTELLEKCTTSSAQLADKLKQLEKAEDELPLVSQLPTSVLLNQITHENQTNLIDFNIKRLEFKVDFAEDDDPDFIDIDTDDSEENDQDLDIKRPLGYQLDDYVDFEAERERQLPFIQSLAMTMLEYEKEATQEDVEQQERFGEHAKMWRAKLEKADRNTKKIHKDNKNRELYERTFPDIRRAREEKERAARSEKRPNAKQEAAMARSRYDERKKVFGSAIIPPKMKTLLMADQPRGRLMDYPIFESQESLHKFLVSWTDYEKAIYQKKFVQYGKNFAAIASCLGTKNTKECVRYYYLTKQDVRYKQLHKTKRKKAGKQYKPNMVPTEGERMVDRIKVFPFMRSNKYVECLICERQMPVYLVPKLVNGLQMPGEYIETCQDKLPLCDQCNNHIRKAKAANFSKCPLVGCSLGRRRTKPNRNIPETANTLEFEKRQFIINRRKLHPEAVKCCGSCIKKIQNDFADLAAGKLDELVKDFARQRIAKKQKKESENIPRWEYKEYVKMKDAITICGISNWYEVASRMAILNKTPFWCYMKYKELNRNGMWSRVGVDDVPSDICEEYRTTEAAVTIINDMMDVVELKDKEPCEAEPESDVRDEGVSPNISPPMEVEEESTFEELMKGDLLAALSSRERQILYHDYLRNYPKQFAEDRPPPAVEYQDEEMPLFSTNHSPRMSIAAPTPIFDAIMKATDDDDDIQIIEVRPPPAKPQTQQQQQFEGSLTQGTPRNNAIGPDASQAKVAPLAENPLTKGFFEEQLMNFKKLQMDELMQKPAPNANVAMSNLIATDPNNIQGFYQNMLNALPQVSAAADSVQKSIPPVEAPASTSGIVNFFLPDNQNQSFNSLPLSNHLLPKVPVLDQQRKSNITSSLHRPELSQFASLPEPLTIGTPRTTSGTNYPSLYPPSFIPHSLYDQHHDMNNIVITTQQPFGLKQLKDNSSSGIENHKNKTSDASTANSQPSPGPLHVPSTTPPSVSEEHQHPVVNTAQRKSGLANTMLPHAHKNAMHIKRASSPVHTEHMSILEQILREETDSARSETASPAPQPPSQPPVNVAQPESKIPDSKAQVPDAQPEQPMQVDPVEPQTSFSSTEQQQQTQVSVPQPEQPVQDQSHQPESETCAAAQPEAEHAPFSPTSGIEAIFRESIIKGMDSDSHYRQIVEEWQQVQNRQLLQDAERQLETSGHGFNKEKIRARRELLAKNKLASVAASAPQAPIPPPDKSPTPVPVPVPAKKVKPPRKRRTVPPAVHAFGRELQDMAAVMRKRHDGAAKILPNPVEQTEKVATPAQPQVSEVVVHQMHREPHLDVFTFDTGPQVSAQSQEQVVELYESRNAGETEDQTVGDVQRGASVAVESVQIEREVESIQSDAEMSPICADQTPEVVEPRQIHAAARFSSIESTELQIAENGPRIERESAEFEPQSEKVGYQGPNDMKSETTNESEFAENDAKRMCRRSEDGRLLHTVDTTAPESSAMAVQQSLSPVGGPPNDNTAVSSLGDESEARRRENGDVSDVDNEREDSDPSSSLEPEEESEYSQAASAVRRRSSSQVMAASIPSSSPSVVQVRRKVECHHAEDDACSCGMHHSDDDFLQDEMEVDDNVSLFEENVYGEDHEDMDQDDVGPFFEYEEEEEEDEINVMEVVSNWVLDNFGHVYGARKEPALESSARSDICMNRHVPVDEIARPSSVNDRPMLVEEFIEYDSFYQHEAHVPEDDMFYLGESYDYPGEDIVIVCENFENNKMYELDKEAKYKRLHLYVSKLGRALKLAETKRLLKASLAGHQPKDFEKPAYEAFNNFPELDLHKNLITSVCNRMLNDMYYCKYLPLLDCTVYETYLQMAANQKNSADRDFSDFESDDDDDSSTSEGDDDDDKGENRVEPVPEANHVQVEQNGVDEAEQKESDDGQEEDEAMEEGLDEVDPEGQEGNEENELSYQRQPMKVLSPTYVRIDPIPYKFPRNKPAVLTLIAQDHSLTLGAPTISANHDNLLAPAIYHPENPNKRRFREAEHAGPTKKKIRLTRKQRNKKRRPRRGSTDSELDKKIITCCSTPSTAIVADTPPPIVREPVEPVDPFKDMHFGVDYSSVNMSNPQVILDEFFSNSESAREFAGDELGTDDTLDGPDDDEISRISNPDALLTSSSDD